MTPEQGTRPAAAPGPSASYRQTEPAQDDRIELDHGTVPMSHDEHDGSAPDGAADASAHHADADCDNAIGQLYLYLDRELGEDAVAEIEEHLRRCSPCLEAYDFESELRRVIAAKCEQSVPGDVRDRMMGLLGRLDAGEFDGDGRDDGANAPV